MLQLEVPQHDEVEHEQVDVVEHAVLVLVDPASSESPTAMSSTSKVSASRRATWGPRDVMRFSIHG